MRRRLRFLSQRNPANLSVAALILALAAAYFLIERSANPKTSP